MDGTGETLALILDDKERRKRKKVLIDNLLTKWPSDSVGPGAKEVS